MTSPYVAVETEGLSKTFGTVRALVELDLSVPVGTVLGLLGPNGAGKTTAVRILATLLRPDAGHARVAGYDVMEHPNDVRRAIGVSGQYAAVDVCLTGRENLRMVGRLSGLGRQAASRRADELLEEFDLVAAGNRRVAGYSGGMRRRLDVAASLVARPAVLFLDEPTTGLDPRGRMALWATIADLARDGCSVLLTTQYLEEADHLADAIVIIDEGRVIAAGAPEELKTQVGGQRLDLRVPAGADTASAAAVVADLGTGPPTVDSETGTVSLPVSDPGALLDALTRLRANELTVSDAAVRLPSLDEAFLALTGHPVPSTSAASEARPTGETA
jgi:daunorubicin resistance ABC transporter ATP-binding subunit